MMRKVQCLFCLNTAGLFCLTLRAGLLVCLLFVCTGNAAVLRSVTAGKVSRLYPEEQSPIDIETASVYAAELPSVVLSGYDRPLASLEFINTGETVRIVPVPEDNNEITVSGAGLGSTYNLAQFHFHWGPTSDVGSEHTVDEHRYPMEVHFVHVNSLYPDLETALLHRDGLAVVGVFLEAGSTLNDLWNEITEDLAFVNEAGTTLTADFPTTILRQLLPSPGSDFYRYRGSLTTPEYSQVVDWIVLSEPVAVSEDQAETRFIETQDKRRATQLALNSIQEKLKDIHTELDRTPRGDDRYLKLITQEHAIIREERKLRDEASLYEKGERDNFSSLSNAVRDSHERERAQGERTKYWSIMGSILGTVVGLLGSTFANRMRMREIRELVAEATNHKTDMTLQVHELSQNSQQSKGALPQLSHATAHLSKEDLQQAVLEISKTISISEKETVSSLLKKLTNLERMLKTRSISENVLQTEFGMEPVIQESSAVPEPSQLLRYERVTAATSAVTLGVVLMIFMKLYGG